MTIQEMRLSLYLSVGELARRMNLGTAVMSRIERGREIPPEAVIHDLATVLQRTPDEIRAALPDPEDVKRADEEFAGFLRVVATAKADAKEKGLIKGVGGRSSCKCPICGGEVRYRVASSNGHMFAACSTETCARWME